MNNCVHLVKQKEPCVMFKCYFGDFPRCWSRILQSQNVSQKKYVFWKTKC